MERMKIVQKEEHLESILNQHKRSEKKKKKEERKKTKRKKKGQFLTPFLFIILFEFDLKVYL